MKVEGVALEAHRTICRTFSWPVCSGCVITVLSENTSAETLYVCHETFLSGEPGYIPAYTLPGGSYSLLHINRSCLGDVVLAVNTLLMQLFTLFSYIMDGFAYAGEALTGKYIGSRRPVAKTDHTTSF